jgi:small subunit ribosomal protein S5
MPKIDPSSLELEERVVKTNKCQKTHKGGRTLSWNALVVVGDGHGHVGAAIGKARGIPDAIRKGFEAAKKELIRVPLAGATIPHQIQSHHGASIVLLKPAAPGTGVVAGGSMRHILEAAGVKDVVAKSLGSANSINTAWATLRALGELRSPGEMARLRGVDAEDLTPRRNGGSSGANGHAPSPAAAVAAEPVAAQVAPATEAPVAHAAEDPASGSEGAGETVSAAVAEAGDAE